MQLPQHEQPAQHAALACHQASNHTLRRPLPLLPASTAQLSTLGYCLLAAVRGGLFSWLNQRLIRRLRSRLFERLVRKETAFFDTNDVGSLTSRLGSDCYAVARCISTNLNVAMRNLLQVIGGWQTRGCDCMCVSRRSVTVCV
jgi:ABC-type multidrug transport system fused ATPase/permease subunit